MKRILWVAFVFPPYGGTQGLWMQKYIEHILRQSADDVLIDVLTIVPSSHYPQYDRSLGKAACSPRVTVHRVTPGVFHGLRHVLNADGGTGGRGGRGPLGRLALSAVSLLGNALWVFPALFWITGQRFAPRGRRYDAVYTFVDPLWSLLVGLAASRLNDARWVVEYGDPWMIKLTTTMKSTFGKWLGGLIERHTLPKADLIVTQVDSVRDAYGKLYPEVPGEKYSTLYGGVEWEDYERAAAGPDPSRFVICHTGLLYGESSGPGPFFSAVKSLAEHGTPVEVVMLGAVDDKAKAAVEKLGIQDRVRFMGHRPYPEVVAHQKSATVLVAFSLNSPYKVPSKISQYIAAGRPILVISEMDGDPSARMVEANRRGVSVMNEEARIYAALLDMYYRWEDGLLDGRFDFSRMESITYSHIAGRIRQALIPQPAPGA